MASTIGEDFQRQTGYSRQKMDFRPLDWSRQPSIYKTYSGKPRIELDKAEITGGPGLWRTIKNRKSGRDFSGLPLSGKQLSQLLWASQGITHRSRGFAFRAAPSAGALYPVETYVVINDVEGIEKGLYHFNIPDFSLEQLKKEALHNAIASAALDQHICATAAVVFVWTAVFQRSIWKYRQRAFRYIYLDAGHIAHAVALAAAGLGLGCCHIAAFFDDEVNVILDVDGEKESAIYMTAVGTPAV
jgi:SagB-type dehydrogenase family enzyme